MLPSGCRWLDFYLTQTLPLINHTMPCPTSFIISGIFKLSHGDRAERPSSATYQPAINSINPNDHLNVLLHKFTWMNESLYKPGTLVFISVKVVLPIGKEGMLEIIYCAPVSFSREILPLGSTHTASVAGMVRRTRPNAPD